MSTTIKPSSLIPLSASYSYDEYTKIKSTVAIWKDGYVTFNHPAFQQNIDTSTNNNTIFYLTSAKNLFGIMESVPLNTVFLGNYVILSINNQYVTNLNNELYLSAVSGNDSYFRIIGNSDNTISFLHSEGLYVTVSEKNPYNLTLESLYASDVDYYQKFTFEYFNNQIYIITTLPEQRYWGYTKYGPEAGKVRANGTVENQEFLFNINKFDVYYIPTGLTKDHTWVDYFNTLNNTENNYNVEISDSASAVNISHLFDLPYNTKIDINANRININLANMKNVQNANYEYSFKTEE